MCAAVSFIPDTLKVFFLPKLNRFSGCRTQRHAVRNASLQRAFSKWSERKRHFIRWHQLKAGRWQSLAGLQWENDDLSALSGLFCSKRWSRVLFAARMPGGLWDFRFWVLSHLTKILYGCIYFLGLGWHRSREGLFGKGLLWTDRSDSPKTALCATDNEAAPVHRGRPGFSMTPDFLAFQDILDDIVRCFTSNTCDLSIIHLCKQVNLQRRSNSKGKAVIPLTSAFSCRSLVWLHSVQR